METIYVMDRNYNINKFDKNIKYNKHNKNNKNKSSKFNIDNEVNRLYKFSLKYSGGWKLAFKKWFKLSDKEPYSILIDNLPENYKVEFDYEIDNNIYNIKLKFTQNITDKSFIVHILNNVRSKYKLEVSHLEEKLENHDKELL